MRRLHHQAVYVRRTPKKDYSFDSITVSSAHSDRGWADSRCHLGWPLLPKVVAALGAVSGEVDGHLHRIALPRFHVNCAILPKKHRRRLSDHLTTKRV